MSMRPAGGPPGTLARCGREHPGGGDLPDRRALQPRAVQRADRRLAGIVVLGPLARLQAPEPRAPPGVLVAPAARLPPPLEGLAEQKTFGEQGLELTGRVFAAWRAYQHEHHDRDQLDPEIEPIQTELRQLLEHAGRKSKRTRFIACSPTTCSRSGPRSGRS